ncbi:MAG: hypothetical protein H6819_06685 [Phycisphaerales bacterium]|nr:hypothetical protein [Phycisphaerales bacterium]MCB9855267.1 hypothetical protein [Phycisphaerales bacterium]MCB9862860.1 hypothetical protein [Phycisphaerales bacterium]
MKFNLALQPTPIVLDPNGDGDVIRIQHEQLTASERATAMELAEQGIAASLQFLYSKFLAWEGVQDENGKPIKLHYNDANGAKKNNADRVFGLLDFSVSIEAWIKQMVINGVSFDRLESAAKINLNDRQLETVREVVARLGKLPATTAAESSND